MKQEGDRIAKLKKQQELIRRLEQRVQENKRQRVETEELLNQVLRSKSWQLTSPLRWIARQCRRIAALPNAPSPTRPQAGEATDSVNLLEALPHEGEDGSALDGMAMAGFHAFLASDSVLALPTSNEPDLSVILVLFNRAELTLACLRSLCENDQPSFEVIIVDNASTDQTPLLLKRTSGVHTIHNTRNIHFLLAVNQAAKKARGRYLLILNNDTQVLPGSIASALHTINDSDDIGAVGGKIILTDGTLQEAGSIIWQDGSCLGYGRGDDPFAPMYMFKRDVDYCSGAFLLTRRDVFEKLGGFDESYQPAYYEETDYCLRLWENGLRVVYDPNAVILHHEFSSASSTQEATDLQISHRQILVDNHRDTINSHLPPEHTNILKARFANAGNPRTLFIEDRVPYPTLGSGFPRARSILLSLLERNHVVTLYPMSILDEEWSIVYQNLPKEVEVMLGYGPELLEDFMQHRCGYYQTIIVSRPHNMELLNPIIQNNPEWFRKTNVIYDAEALFTFREVGLRKLRGETVTEKQEQELLRRETELSWFADTVVSVSEKERKAFMDQGLERVFVLTHSIREVPTPRSFEDRSGFLFVGAIHEESSPNGDSVLWFIEQIFPRIQSALGTEVIFTVAGLNNSVRIRQLASERVRILGCLDHLTDLYDRNRVFVAPTRFAAGIPLKIIEAAGHGLPVVATSLLAEQLGWRDREHLTVAGSADTFAAKCVELYSNKGLWEEIRAAALEQVRMDCSPKSFESQLNAILSVGKKGSSLQPPAYPPERR